MSGAIELIRPDWPAPPAVRAVVTTRTGGVSGGPYASLNLADHVADDPAAVAENRARIAAAAGLPARPRWLRQVHGHRAVDAAVVGAGCEADAAYAVEPGVVCAVLTADCLPILLCDEAGSRVAALHAGWRGLAGGVVESAVGAWDDPKAVMAWLGPAIGPDAFEVGPEVREAFLAQDRGAAGAFRPGAAGRWWADLYALAHLRLQAAGVARVHGGGFCTYHERERFYSYRRDGETGRMASLVWLEE